MYFGLNCNLVSGQIQQQQQVVITAGGQITLQQTPIAQKPSGSQQGLPLIVQTNSNQPRQQMLLSQNPNAPLLMSQALQGQVQLVSSGSQSNQQYVISTGGPQPQLMVAQQQTALVQGQTQTVLVAQTPQQQGTPSKTIIILQPQSGSAVNQQKIVVTPQGQQMVVTQVQRPILQTTNVCNSLPNLISTPQTINQNNSMVKMIQSSTVSSNGIGKVILKADSSRPNTPTTNNNNDSKNVPSTSQLSPTPPIIRDLTNPYICEWRGCTR